MTDAGPWSLVRGMSAVAVAHHVRDFCLMFMVGVDVPPEGEHDPAQDVEFVELGGWALVRWPEAFEPHVALATARLAGATEALAAALARREDEWIIHVFDRGQEIDRAITDPGAFGDDWRPLLEQDWAGRPRALALALDGGATGVPEPGVHPPAASPAHMRLREMTAGTDDERVTARLRLAAHLFDRLPTAPPWVGDPPAPPHSPPE